VGRFPRATRLPGSIPPHSRRTPASR
jgi:hypothetical protein